MYFVFRWRAPCKAATAEGLPSLNICNNNNNNSSQKHVLVANCIHHSKQQISKYQCIEKVLRQGCVLSPDLFTLYNVIIIRNIKDRPGIGIGGVKINSLKYADNIALIAETEEELQDLEIIIHKESGNMGLSLNIKKTEAMIISKLKDLPTCDIKLNNTTLKPVENLKYLGAAISADGKCRTEMVIRIMQAKKTFEQMKQILVNQNISTKVCMRVLH